MTIHGAMGGHARFEAYVPVLCTAPSPERPVAKRLAGKTRSVGVGGLALLLPEALPAGSPLVVRVWRGDPLRGLIVWVGRGTRADLRTTFPHGVAFQQPVDSAVVRHWLSQAKRHPDIRVPVRFAVEYADAGVPSTGTCLNLSRGGMFVATTHPAPPETEVTLHFTLPDLRSPLRVRARVVWTRGKATGPGLLTGMGIQFLGPTPSQAAFIGDVVDRLCREELPSPDSFRN
ncbi:MAG: TIGR02266 family protein [Candidatus Methylomirabilales bacterium]